MPRSSIFDHCTLVFKVIVHDANHRLVGVLNILSKSPQIAVGFNKLVVGLQFGIRDGSKERKKNDLISINIYKSNK